MLRTFFAFLRLWMWGALLAVLVGPASAKTLAPEENYAGICERFAQRMPRLHLLHLEMGDLVSSRTWTNLIVSLDYERMYFLQSDLDRFRARETHLDDELKNGDMSFAFEVFDVFKARLSNRVEAVGQILQTGFDWTQEESFVWQRKDAVWPADEVAWNDLWRRKIKNEYVRILISREQEASNALASVTNLTNATVAVDVRFDAPIVLPPDGAEVVTAPSVTTVVVVGTNSPTPTGTVAKIEEPIEVLLQKRYRQAATITEDSDADALLQRYLTAFTQAYDPHSTYLTPSALKDFEIEMNLALFGIGALLSSEDGAAKIVRLIPGGPADRDTRDKHLQAGDKIIGVAQDNEPNVDILHWPLSKIVQLIRGEKGTRVVLTVIPASDPSGTITKVVDLERDEVKLEDQAATGTVHRVISPEGVIRNLGVIRLPAFYSSMGVRSPDEPGFRSAVYDVVKLITTQKAQGIDGLIFDLRGNGGGALVEAIDMTGLFIRRGPTVQVKERLMVRPLDDEDPRVYYNGPLVVLINRLSASASEIVAGALQDYGRAVLVGDSKTHGKGTVQSVLDLGNDASLGSLKVTTASYIRITGASTQQQGVQPDIVVPSPWDFMETGEEFLPNPIPWSMESAANFRPVADLAPLLPRLRERSEQRRRQSAAFQTYARMLERIAYMNETHELPLNLDARRQLAAAERELSDMQERLADEEHGDTTNKVNDLVLSEGLSILSDLVTIETAGLDALPPLEPMAAPEHAVADWEKEHP